MYIAPYDALINHTMVLYENGTAPTCLVIDVSKFLTNN